MLSAAAMSESDCVYRGGTVAVTSDRCVAQPRALYKILIVTNGIQHSAYLWHISTNAIHDPIFWHNVFVLERSKRVGR